MIIKGLSGTQIQWIEHEKSELKNGPAGSPHPKPEDIPAERPLDSLRPQTGDGRTIDQHNCGIG
jgi:hypothetical protein